MKYVVSAEISREMVVDANSHEEATKHASKSLLPRTLPKGVTQRSSFKVKPLVAKATLAKMREFFDVDEWDADADVNMSEVRFGQP